MALIFAVAMMGLLAISVSGATAQKGTSTLKGRALLEEPELSPMVWSQCPEGAGCVWSGYESEGQLSYWYPGSGCHNHEENPKIRSAWNRTDYWLRIGIGEIPPHSTWSNNPAYNPLTGEVCFVAK